MGNNSIQPNLIISKIFIEFNGHFVNALLLPILFLYAFFAPRNHEMPWFLIFSFSISSLFSESEQNRRLLTFSPTDFHYTIGKLQQQPLCFGLMIFFLLKITHRKCQLVPICLHFCSIIRYAHSFYLVFLLPSDQ